MGNLHISRILHLLRCRKESIFLPQIKTVSNHHLHHQQKANKSHKINPNPFATKTICAVWTIRQKKTRWLGCMQNLYMLSPLRDKKGKMRTRVAERERGGRKESRRRNSILSQEMNHFLPPIFLLSLWSLHYPMLPPPCNKESDQ